jgi:hypothetical protein
MESVRRRAAWFGWNVKVRARPHEDPPRSTAESACAFRMGIEQEKA